MAEKEKFKVWAISTYERHGEDIDTLSTWVNERFKLYKKKEDAYKFLFGTTLRAYVRATTPDRIRTVGRPIVGYASGTYRNTGFMQFNIVVRYDEFDPLDSNRYIYEAIQESVF